MLCFEEEKATPPHLHTITKTQQHTRLLLFDRCKLFYELYRVVMFLRGKSGFLT